MAEFEGAQALERVKAVAAIPHGGTGDVKYHHGAEGHVHDRRRRDDQGPPLSEPEPPRVRRSGGDRRRPCRPDLARRPHPRAQPGAAPCRCCCTATPPSRARAWWPRRSTCSRSRATRPAARPHHHRQPGGLHDRSRGGALDALRLRHGEGLQRPDHPRERRRRRGVHRGDPPRDGLPRALEPRHRHRPDRLPPLRAQRDRRARLHAADDGRPDQGAPAGLGDLRRNARQGGSGHSRGRRDGEHRGHARSSRRSTRSSRRRWRPGTTRPRPRPRSAPASSTAPRARTSTPRSRPSACGP